MKSKKPYSLAMIPAAALSSILKDFTCQQLRAFAKRNGIRPGRNKADAILNLTSPEALVAYRDNGVTVTVNG